jgi:pterin-4a-carbinolamine dehydratase
MLLPTTRNKKNSKKSKMKNIFISYRRADSCETNRLATALKAEYGENNIFVDYQSIQGGDDWPVKIEKEINQSAVLIVMMGKNWLFTQDEHSGKRKIDMEGDWVRKEIITFLKRCRENNDLIILPVLTNGAKMPKKEYLDPEINQLCDFNAMELPSTMSSVDFIHIKQRLETAKIYTSPLPLSETPIGEPLPDALTEEQEASFLAENKSWKIVERDKPGKVGTTRELYRNYHFKSYNEAWKFMSMVHKNGIKAFNHHPRWQNTYNRVEVWLCTFNIGHKPSERDLRLANIFEKTWKQIAMGFSADDVQEGDTVK